MSGLLYNIQSYFDKTYQGRYLACFLAELFDQNKKQFSIVMKELGVFYTAKDGDFAKANYWRLTKMDKKDNTRFADLAVVNARNEPMIIVEGRRHR